MSLKEVRDLLGSQGEDVAGEVITINENGRLKPAIRGDRLMVWPGSHAWIWIGFDNGKVASKYIYINRL